MKIVNTVRNIAIAAAFTLGIVSSRAGDLVPSNAKTAGSVTSKTYLANPAAVPLGTPFLHAHSVGVGVANQLGKYTVNLDELDHLEVIDGKLMVVSVGNWLATAANGDQLSGTYVNYRVNGELAFTGTSEITGGTGRFEGATGYETTVGELAPNLLDFTYEHEGFITTVGSRRGNGH